MNSDYIKKLRTAQRFALIKVTKAYRTTSHESLHATKGSAPIELECIRRTHLFRIRTSETVNIAGKRFALTGEEGKKSRGEAKEELDNYIMTKWQTEWDETENSRLTYEYIPDLKERRKAYWLTPNRRCIQFITGHGDFRSFEKRFKFRKSNKCSCAKKAKNKAEIKEEEPLHILRDCSKWAKIREKYRVEHNLDLKNIKLPELLTKKKFPFFKNFTKEVMKIKEETSDQENDSSEEDESEEEENEDERRGGVALSN